jgi:hypothetical protein
MAEPNADSMRPEPNVDALTKGVWHFSEAVSLLAEARQYLPEATGLAEEIDDELPAIREALNALAAVLMAPDQRPIGEHAMNEHAEYVLEVWDQETAVTVTLSALDEKGYGHGYRISGPKLGESARCLQRHVLDERDRREILSLLKPTHNDRSEPPRVEPPVAFEDIDARLVFFLRRLIGEWGLRGVQQAAETVFRHDEQPSEVAE